MSLDTNGFGQQYWDNKWPKNTVIYSGRTLPKKNTVVGIDVTQFFDNHDALLQAIVQQFSLKKATPNDTALACQQFVVKYLNYLADSDNDGADEFWQFSFETIENGSGDCEDGAILMANLMINAGVPAWRVKVAAGFVQEAPTAPQGGHCYCLYLADRPDQEKQCAWLVMDWCYYEDSKTPVAQKPLAKDGGYKGCYKDVWFSFNGENCWSGGEIGVFDGRVAAKEDVILEQIDKSEDNIVANLVAKIRRKIPK